MSLPPSATVRWHRDLRRRAPGWLAAPKWIGVIGLLAAAAWAFAAANLDDVLPLFSMKTIGLNFALAKAWIAENPLLSVVLYIAAYAAIAVLFLPGSALLVVSGGLLFGAAVGIPLAWVASVVAATAAFLFARGLAVHLLPNAPNATLGRLRTGFNRHAFSYMLFLRLSPGLPFALVNAAPAALGVRLRTFLAGTALGFIPSRIALVTAGAGLGGVLEAQNDAYNRCLANKFMTADQCPYDIQVARLLTAETLAAFLALAILALMPAAIERLSAVVKSASGSTEDVDGKPASGRDREGP